MLTSKTPETIAPFDELKARVMQDWQQQEVQQKLTEAISRMTESYTVQRSADVPVPLAPAKEGA